MADRRKQFSATFDDDEFLLPLRKMDPAAPPKKGSPAYTTQEVQEDESVITGFPKYAEVTTQGKKGFAVKRINLGFTAENHIFIKRAAQNAGQSITGFVNDLINKYRCDPYFEVQEAQDVQEVQQEERRPVSIRKRINMGFTEETYNYLKAESRKKGRSITDFVNCILSEYGKNFDMQNKKRLTK